MGRHCTACVVNKELDVDCEENTCLLKIEVWESTYNYGEKDRDKLLYVRVQTSLPFSENLPPHPFDHLEDVRDGAIEYREIIADNDYSRMLIKWLCFEDQELNGKTGSKTIGCYRSKLIGQLAGMWD
jgi:hypothetical protein